MEICSWSITLEVCCYICFRDLSHKKRKNGDRLKVFEIFCFSFLLGNGVLITIIIVTAFAYGFINLPTLAFVFYTLTVLLVTFINFLILAYLKSQRYKGSITYKLALGVLMM